VEFLVLVLFETFCPAEAFTAERERERERERVGVSEAELTFFRY